MKRHLGFTLLELLVALTIFAVLATIAYSGLISVLTLRDRTDAYAVQLAQLQKAFTRFTRDIEQYVHRPIRNEYGDFEPALMGTLTRLEWTHAGWRNPAQQLRSELQRVAYYAEDNHLWLVYWPVLDRAQDSRPVKVALLSDVKRLQFRFLDDKWQWHEQWPPTATESIPSEATVHIYVLKAIEMTINIIEWGEITRLFRVADSDLWTQPRKLPESVDNSPNIPK